MAIGRSGTGKTTCALFRLFATEILFKAKSNFANRGILKDTRFHAEDIDTSCGLHTVFVTASPVLTNEVRRYYDHLNSKIKEELNKKDKQAKLKENPDIEIISKEEIEKPKEGTELQRIEELRGIDEELEIIDENELEKQIQLPQTMISIPDAQFPLFLTLRRLLLMIDGTVKRPFFSRNSKGEIIGLGRKCRLA